MYISSLSMIMDKDAVAMRQQPVYPQINTTINNGGVIYNFIYYNHSISITVYHKNSNYSCRFLASQIWLCKFIGVNMHALIVGGALKKRRFYANDAVYKHTEHSAVNRIQKYKVIFKDSLHY